MTERNLSGDGDSAHQARLLNRVGAALIGARLVQPFFNLLVVVSADESNSVTHDTERIETEISSTHTSESPVCMPQSVYAMIILSPAVYCARPHVSFS